MEAGIGAFQPSSRFPINPSPYGISGLAIGQVLRTLQNNDESQAPGHFGWLSDAGIAVGKLVIVINRPKFIAHHHIPISTGKGGVSHFGSPFRYIED
jgi:hypothetical protein